MSERIIILCRALLYLVANLITTNFHWFVPDCFNEYIPTFTNYSNLLKYVKDLLIILTLITYTLKT